MHSKCSPHTSVDQENAGQDESKKSSKFDVQFGQIKLLYFFPHISPEKKKQKNDKQKALPGNCACSRSILAQTVFSPVSLSLSPLWARLLAGVSSSSSVAMIQQPDSISSLSHRRCSHALSLSSAGSLCCRNTSWELFLSARETGSRSGQCSEGGRVHRWWSLNLCLCIAHSWFRVAWWKYEVSPE